MAKRTKTRKEAAAPKITKAERADMQAKTLKAIGPLAKRINAALEKASVADGSFFPCHRPSGHRGLHDRVAGYEWNHDKEG